MSELVPGGWTYVVTPATGATASIVINAGGPGVSHVLSSVKAKLACAAPAAHVAFAPSVQVLDGATVIFSWVIALDVPAGVAGENSDTLELGLIGTPATSMTVRFSAGLAGVVEALLIQGVDL